MPAEERPRERLVKYGAKTLRTSELLAIILETGTKEESVLDLSKRMLYELNKTSDLSRVTYHELIKIKGIKMAKATKVIAAIELGRRLNKENSEERMKITSDFDIFNLVYDEVKDLEQESFYVVYLNSQHEVISVENIFIGTLNQVLIHPREIFKRAYQLSSNSIILVHNHPSGNSMPSSQDINITQNIIDVGGILQINVLDHLIIGRDEFYSIRKQRKTKIWNFILSDYNRISKRKY